MNDVVFLGAVVLGPLTLALAHEESAAVAGVEVSEPQDFPGCTWLRVRLLALDFVVAWDPEQSIRAASEDAES